MALKEKLFKCMHEFDLYAVPSSYFRNANKPLSNKDYFSLAFLESLRLFTCAVLISDILNYKNN